MSRRRPNPICFIKVVDGPLAGTLHGDPHGQATLPPATSIELRHATSEIHEVTLEPTSIDGIRLARWIRFVRNQAMDEPPRSPAGPSA